MKTNEELAREAVVQHCQRFNIHSDSNAAQNLRASFLSALNTATQQQEAEHKLDIAALDSMISGIEAELEKLREDKEALDWLQEQTNLIVREEGDGDWAVWDDGTLLSLAPTLREAIINAKKDEKE